MDTNVRICMFGGFNLYIDNDCKNAGILKSKKGMSLLQYIILKHDTAVPNYRLIELLWPNEESSNPENALKTLVSRFRAPITIVGRTTDEAVWRKLNLSWGVLPLLTEEFDSLEVMFYNSLKITAELLDLKKGDNVVMTGGSQTGVKGSTNTIKVATV